MSRRNRRQDPNRLGSWLTGLSLLAVLAGLLRRGPRRRGPLTVLAPVVLLMMLVGAFITMALILAFLSGLAALFSDPGSLALACGMPAAITALVAWAIYQGRRGGKRRPSDESDRTGAGTSAATGMSAADSALASNDAAASRLRPAPEATSAYDEKAAPSPGEYRQRAASYRRRIQSLVKNWRRGPLADKLGSVVPKLRSWEERVGQLADRLALYETDDLIRRDIREVPNHIARLRRQANLEADPEMRRQMMRTLGAYEQQQSHLEALARMMRRTRLNLDDTLAAMGTVYSQVQVLNAMDVDGPTAARIADDIDREVHRLNDLLSALNEVNRLSNAEPSPVAGQTDADTPAGAFKRQSHKGSTYAR